MAVSEAGTGKGLCLLSSAEPGVSQLPGTAALTGNEAEQSLGKRRDCGWGECGGSTAGEPQHSKPPNQPQNASREKKGRGDPGLSLRGSWLGHSEHQPRFQPGVGGPEPPDPTGGWAGGGSFPSSRVCRQIKN